jgi:hypothetical protein
MMPHPESSSHNACCVNHFDVSYWIQVDRGDFPVTDIIGEFSIIDPCFQLETYGNHLQSDRSFIKNYAVRRCFVEFSNYLPQSFDGKKLSFAILRQNFPMAREGKSVFVCRCFFSDSEYCDPSSNPVDFELSLSIEFVGANKTRKEK